MLKGRPLLNHTHHINLASCSSGSNAVLRWMVGTTLS